MVVTLAFALVWLNGVEFFPISAMKMYSRVWLGSEFYFTQARDARGSVINDNAAFFVANYRSGDEIAGEKCFTERGAACTDYFTLVANWLRQNITVEDWTWDYKTGVYTQQEVLTIPCDCQP